MKSTGFLFRVGCVWLLTICAQEAAAQVAYASIAYSESARVSSTAKSYSSREDAERIAVATCNIRAPQRDCKPIVWVGHENGCVALARDLDGYVGVAAWQIPLPATREQALSTARSYALQFCQKGSPTPGNCQVESQECTRTYAF